MTWGGEATLKLPVEKLERPTPEGCTSTKDFVNFAAKGGTIALHLALEAVPQAGLSRAISETIQLSNNAEGHSTPPSVATPRASVAEILVTAGSDVNAVDDEGNSPLVLASGRGSMGSVQLLLGAGAVTERNGHERLKTALQSACAGSHLACASLLLDHGARVDSEDSESRTPLHFACCGSKWQAANRELVQLLLSHNADVTARDRYEATPLHYACMDMWTIAPRMDAGVVEDLIAAGADTYAKDRRGDTPWDVALPGAGLEKNLSHPINMDMSFLLGPPGSGKTTQAKRLERAFAFKVITLESCLEEASKQRTGILKALERLRADSKGQIPATLVATALRSCLEIHQRSHDMAEGATAHRVCLEGFPSTREEASEIEKDLGRPHFVISLETPYQDAMRRLCLDVSGKRISPEVVEDCQARYKAFPTTFEALQEYYREQATLQTFKASEKEGIMTVFNQIKILFGYMEAQSIVAKTVKAKQTIVQGPKQRSVRSVHEAHQKIRDMRSSTATQVRLSTVENEEQLHHQCSELERTNYQKGRLIVESNRKGSHNMANCEVNKRFR